MEQLGKLPGLFHAAVSHAAGVRGGVQPLVDDDRGNDQDAGFRAPDIQLPRLFHQTRQRVLDVDGRRGKALLAVIGAQHED
ncbi:hypothetical protein SDC9_188875 [bioreactor metagenome]|uniref:Uncharacterized protein n=1 Tax=bioreactor metagenome TaxID=1076179 RepID=A0A645HS70_9ZZZZ